jgi:hypothetical protein
MKNTTAEQGEIDAHEYAENAAAIMFDWRDDTDAYLEMYDTYKDQFGGFAGIYCIAADAAVAFTKEASSYVPGEDYYWIEAIEDFALKTLSYLQVGEIPSIDDMHLIAAGCIEKCMIK